ncbi:hypothetical protein [Halobacillus sp. Marseille-Q1614]|uniref:hypothetical protein n=1 Tax=Halobacillus sp. Marseille-Q1614 TaxID=2709134 RepID=UPI0015702979|nr:hypothetical protein [Halobacillus sp. Marseille-Q1614]
MNLSTWEVYRWVRGQRFKKKFKLYKQAFLVTLDWTILIYMLIFSAAFLFMLADWLKQFMPLVESWQMNVEQWLWILPSALLVKAVLQSFLHSGLAFTTSELKLSMLPHTRKDLLWQMALERGGWQLLGMFGLAFTVAVLTPFTFPFAFRLAAIYCLFFTLTIVIQWKLYSVSKWKKLMWMIFVIASVAGIRGLTGYFEWNQSFAGLSLGLILLGVNVCLLPYLLHQVDWGRVVEVNDARVWNIRLVSQMTKVEIKPPKRYGIVQTYFRRKRARQRFNQVSQLYHRLWRHYFLQNFGYVWKTMGVCILVLGILPYQASWIIYIAAPIALFVYVEVAASLYIDQFNAQPLLAVIPIEEEGWQESFFHWGAWGLVPLIVVFFITAWITGGSTLFLVIQTGCAAAWGLIDFKQQLKERTRVFLRKRVNQQDWLRLTGYVFLGLGLYFPPALLGLFLPMWMNRKINLMFLRPKV